MNQIELHHPKESKEPEMDKAFKKLATVVLIGCLVVFTAWVAWWFLRWTTGVEVFELVRDHLHDSLGFSTAVAAAIAIGTGLIAAFLLSVLVIKAHFMLAAGLLFVVVGVPLGLLHDALSADQCFNRKTGLPLCEVWERPDGGHTVRRKDGRQPPSSWQVLRDATRVDARAYLQSDGVSPVDAAVRVPRPVVLQSCMPWPTFFDAGNEAVVYWSRGTDKIELWDRRGTHPTTGVALKPMTAAVAAEVCAKLDAAKKQREARNDQERVVQAARQAVEHEAQQIAQRQGQAQEEARLRLEQQNREDDRRSMAARQAAAELAQQAAQQAQRQQRQPESSQQRVLPRQEDERRSAVDAARPSDWVAGVSQPTTTLTLNNWDCRATDLYLNGQKVVTVQSNSAQSLLIQAGHHMVRVCQVGTSMCGLDIPVNAMNGPVALMVNWQLSCGSPSTSFASQIPWTNRVPIYQSGLRPFRAVQR